MLIFRILFLGLLSLLAYHHYVRHHRAVIMGNVIPSTTHRNALSIEDEQMFSWHDDADDGEDYAKTIKPSADDNEYFVKQVAVQQFEQYLERCSTQSAFDDDDGFQLHFCQQFAKNLDWSGDENELAQYFGDTKANTITAYATIDTIEIEPIANFRFLVCSNYEETSDRNDVEFGANKYVDDDDQDYGDGDSINTNNNRIIAEKVKKVMHEDANHILMIVVFNSTRFYERSETRDSNTDPIPSKRWMNVIGYRSLGAVKADTPTAIKQSLRRTLATATDRSVTIVAIGDCAYVHLTNLLRSRPDRFFPLSGQRLVQRKVRQVFVMKPKKSWDGFRRNIDSGANVNLASIRFAAEWPTRVRFSEIEIVNVTCPEY